jgi:branched-chain amino acid transport system substrate-binding protein
VAQKYQIPLITPASTNERVTQVGDYIFRVCFIDPFQGEVLAKFAYNDLKARKVAVLKEFSRTTPSASPIRSRRLSLV